MPDHFFYFVRLSKDGKANLQRVKNTGVVEEFLHLNVFRGTSEGIFISAISSYTLGPSINYVILKLAIYVLKKKILQLFGLKFTVYNQEWFQIKSGL
jgi:hypothetical protein